MEQYNNHYDTDSAPIMSIGDWIITFFLVSIPVLNVIMLIMWVVDKNANPNRRNWAIATLVLIALGTVIWVAFMGAIVGAISGLVNI